MSLVSRVRCISCVNNFPRNLYGAPFVIYLEDITSGTRVAVRSHDTSLDLNAVTLEQRQDAKRCGRCQPS